MIGFRGLLELVLDWLPFAQRPPVPACVTLAHAPAATVSIAHAPFASVALAHAPLTTITIEDECR